MPLGISPAVTKYSKKWIANRRLASQSLGVSILKYDSRCIGEYEKTEATLEEAQVNFEQAYGSETGR
jgi:hypothetical protein